MPDEPTRSQKEKMLAGELYDPLDSELTQARDRARDMCRDLNATRAKDKGERRRILKELFGQGGETVWMEPPFFCDYGSNIVLGQRAFFNFNCVVLDVCQVKIGEFTLFGPAVQISQTELNELEGHAKSPKQLSSGPKSSAAPTSLSSCQPLSSSLAPSFSWMPLPHRRISSSACRRVSLARLVVLAF